MSSSDSEDSTAGMASATNDMNLASAEAFPSLPAASKPVFGAAPAWGSKGPAASRAAPAPAPVSSGASEVFSLPPQSIDPRVRQQGVADAVKEVYRQVPGCEVKVRAHCRAHHAIFRLIRLLWRFRFRRRRARACLPLSSRPRTRTTSQGSAVCSSPPAASGYASRSTWRNALHMTHSTHTDRHAAFTDGDSFHYSVVGSAPSHWRSGPHAEGTCCQVSGRNSGMESVDFVCGRFTDRTAPQIPKQAAKPEGEAAIPVSFDEDEEETEITITGDAEGIEMARKEIEAVVLQRVSCARLVLRVADIFQLDQRLPSRQSRFPFQSSSIPLCNKLWHLLWPTLGPRCTFPRLPTRPT